MSQTKKPKETDAIKQKLEHYAAFQRRIDNQIERLEYLESVMGAPSSPNLSGEPSGGGDGSSKTERQVLKKLELQQAIRDMIADEAAERKELEEMIEQMERPDERHRNALSRPCEMVADMRRPIQWGAGLRREGRQVPETDI